MVVVVVVVVVVARPPQTLQSRRAARPLIGQRSPVSSRQPACMSIRRWRRQLRFQLAAGLQNQTPLTRPLGERTLPTAQPAATPAQPTTDTTVPTLPLANLGTPLPQCVTEQDHHPDGDAGVSEVEDRPMVAADVDIDDIGKGIEIDSPYMLRNQSAAEYATWMTEKEFEQCELLCGQLKAFTSASHLV